MALAEVNGKASNAFLEKGDWCVSSFLANSHWKVKILSKSEKNIGLNQTRSETTNKTTTIDHVWTNEEMKLVTDAGTVEGISDHTGIYSILDTRKEKPVPEKITYRCYKDYSQQSFNEELAQALEDPQLKELLDTEQPSKATEKFTQIFLDTAEKHAPIREKLMKEKKKQVPWFTTELKELIEEKAKRLKLYWLDGYYSDLKIVKSITNKISHL